MSWGLVVCLIACATGVGILAILLALSRRRQRPQTEPIVTPAGEPEQQPSRTVAATPLPMRPRVVTVHAPDPLEEPVARLEAEMALSAVFVAAELRAPLPALRPAAAAVLDPPVEREPAREEAVATVFTVDVEPALRLDQFVELPQVVPAPEAEPPPTRRRVAPWLLGPVLAVGLALCMVLLAAGSQAPAASTRYPIRNVVGMPRDDARTALSRDGVRITTVRADHGPPGVVLQESGFSADGTYGPGSRIVLLIGGG